MTLPLRTHIVLVVLLWSAFILVTPSAANAGLILQAPTYLGLNSGLVSWWTFDGDDMYGNTALDRIGSNQGPLTGGAARSIGNLGQAVEFDGVNDMIDTTASNGLHNLSPMTISLWIRPRTFGESSPGAAFLSKGDQECFSNPAIDDGWTFGIAWANNEPGELCFQAGFASGNLNVESVQDTVTLNEWQHIVLSWDGTAEADNVLFFRSAAAVAMSFKDDGAGARNDDSADFLMIGANDDTSLNYDGLMDEIRIYNRQLSPDEIKRLYKIGSTAKFGVSNSRGAHASGLNCWWTFDGNDMAQNNSGLLTAYDRSGNGNAASSTSAGVTPVKSSGRIGQALSFDGSDDRLLAGDSSSLDISGGGSIASWFKLDPAGFGTFRAIASKGIDNADDEHNYHLAFLDNDELLCNVGNGSIADSHSTSFDFLDTDWHHAACTWDGSSFSIYVDGVFREGSTQTVTPVANDDLLQIGDWGPGGDNHQGLMDDLRIYNRALTADEVKRLYKMGSTARFGVSNSTGSLSNGLVGWWTFDGNDIAGVTAYDRSGQSTNGTLTGGPQRTIGKIGQALEFDQTDDFVSLGNMDVAGSAMTISVWVYQGAVPNGADCFASADCRIVDKSGGTAEQDIFWMLSTIWDGSKPVLRARLSTSGTTHTLIASSGEVKDGEWTHAVMRYDGSTLKLYKDAVEVGSMSKTGPIDTDDFWPAAIGVAAQSETLNWLGKLDDVRIYNRALSAEEVRRLYNIGR